MSDKTPEIIETDFDYYFARYCDYNGYDESVFVGKPNMFLNALKDIGDHLFPPLPERRREEQRTENELRLAFKWYTDKCQKYELMPTMSNYGVLIHVNREVIAGWLAGRKRGDTYFQDCMVEFASYCETAMSNATLAEEVPVVSGIFHLKAVHGWNDQPEQKPIEVVHSVQALSDISQRYGLSFRDKDTGAIENKGEED